MATEDRKDKRESFAVSQFKRLARNLYNAADIARTVGNHSVESALTASANAAARFGMEVEEREKKSSSETPLVIIEGDKVQGIEAILVGGARAIFVDWTELKADPYRARDTYYALEDFFVETRQVPDNRIRGIMMRLCEIIDAAKLDDVKPVPFPGLDTEDDDEDLGDYNGIPHTGDANCPACSEFARDHPNERFIHNLRSVFGDSPSA